MGSIVWSTNITLDGVVEDPDGKEGSDLGGWFGEYGNDDLAEWSASSYAEAVGAEALLLGRRSDEWFASRWTTRTGEFADRLNAMPKHVASSSTSAPAWNNATRLGSDVVAAAAALRHEAAGEVLIYASYQLGRALLEHGLVDELRLSVFPVALGGGERLFGTSGPSVPLRVLRSTAIGQSIVHITYQPVRRT